MEGFMLGAIAGDVIGSIYENFNVKRTDFTLLRKISIFTDDTVMTLAVADVLLSGGAGNPEMYVSKLQEWFRMYPFAGYGGSFLLWATMQKRQALQ